MELDEEAYGSDIPEPSPQEEEIANTKWIALEDFLKSSAPRGLYGDMIRIGAPALPHPPALMPALAVTSRGACGKVPKPGLAAAQGLRRRRSTCRVARSSACR